MCLKWKTQQLVKEPLDSIYRGSPKNTGVYLEISFGLFDHKKIPRLFQHFTKFSAKFQDFPGLFRTGRNYDLEKVSYLNNKNKYRKISLAAK